MFEIKVAEGKEKNKEIMLDIFLNLVKLKFMCL